MPADESTLRVVAVPYDSGYRDLRQGLGPASLIADWQAYPGDQLEHLEISWVESANEFPTEVATTFELTRLVALEVQSALEAGCFPLVLAGNCNTSVIGGVAGLGLSDPRRDIGVVCFDAHGDFNTPETDPGGFLDGQGLAIVTGRCWQGPVAKVPGFAPVKERSVLLIGAHDFDADESVAIERSGITLITPSRISHDGVEVALGEALAALARRVRRVYLHIDLDVIDAGFGRANSYASVGGLQPDQLFAAARSVIDHLPVVAAGIAAYDPTADETGRIRAAAMQVLDLLRAAPRSRSTP